MRNLITDVPGVQVGNAHDGRAATGVTGAVFDKSWVASIWWLGGAPGERASELLEPEMTRGAIDTARAASAGPAPSNRTNRPIPRKRFGTVDEIAAMVRLLVGPEGIFITGQTIHVNGGEFLT